MAARSVPWRVATLAGTFVIARALHATAAFLGAAPPTTANVHGRIAGQATPASAKMSALGIASPMGGLAMPLAGALAAAVAVRAARAAEQPLRWKRAATALQVTSRTEWYRKVKRIGGDQAVFDVTIPKPLGVKIEKFPQRKGIGISQVVEDGNADKINRRVCIDDEPGSGMWVLEGDRVLAVNGNDCEDGTIEDISKFVQAAGDDVTLTLMRNTRKGPIKVVLMPEGFAMTVRRGSRLSAAAEAAAGRELKYGCIDGWCGTCWHRERTTNGIFKP